MQPILVFSSLGHLYVHLCTAFYFVIVLALEPAWQIPYPELIGLWTLGSLLVGVAALPAGMLGDRIGSEKMMVGFFIGMGACSIAAGLANSPTGLMLALTGLGLFAAIYHPVGIPWLVRNAGSARGKALGFNGIFGSLGAAGAGLTAGITIDLIGWRAAFIIPGIVCGVTGLVLMVYVSGGLMMDRTPEPSQAVESSRQEMMRAFVILAITMFLAGLVYHTIQTSLPKVFEERHGGLAGQGTMGIGLLVAAVYTTAGVMQLAGGYLADRFPLKSVYIGAILVQIPTLWLVSSLGGLPLLVVAAIMVMAGAGALPAENMLLARYTPQHRHGMAFGFKFALSFGAAPLAVQLVARLNEATGGFRLIFVVLTGFALLAFLASLFLPSERLSASG